MAPGQVFWIVDASGQFCTVIRKDHLPRILAVRGVSFPLDNVLESPKTFDSGQGEIELRAQSQGYTERAAFNIKDASENGDDIDHYIYQPTLKVPYRETEDTQDRALHRSHYHTVLNPAQES